MGTVIVGLSHKTSPVTIRERVAFDQHELPGALERLAGLKGIREALILSTCNRVELVVQAEAEDEAAAALKAFLHQYHALEHAQLDSFLYEFQSTAATRHMFRVACGLDSMVVGECQILGQIRKAYDAAVKAGCIGGGLKRLVQRTFEVAKRVRRQTRISTAAWSVSQAAVELAKKVLGALDDRTILVVGAGRMSELTARHLQRSGARKVLVANRTYEHGAQIAARFHGEAVALETLGDALARSDIIISSAASPGGYVIRCADVEDAVRGRENRPLVFIDIAVPRNVDPTVSALRGVHLWDIDSLEGVVASREREVAEVVATAEHLVVNAAYGFADRDPGRQMGRAITALQDRIYSIGSSELEHHLGKLTTASSKDRQTLEAMVRRITNKFLHPLIIELKRRAGASGSPDYLEILTLAYAGDDAESQYARRGSGERS